MCNYDGSYNIKNNLVTPWSFLVSLKITIIYGVIFKNARFQNLLRMVIRLLLGLTNGTMAASRTSLREVCGRQHVVIGMAYLGGENIVSAVHRGERGGFVASWHKKCDGKILYSLYITFRGGLQAWFMLSCPFLSPVRVKVSSARVGHVYWRSSRDACDSLSRGILLYRRLRQVCLKLNSGTRVGRDGHSEERLDFTLLFRLQPVAYCLVVLTTFPLLFLLP